MDQAGTESPKPAGAIPAGYVVSWQLLAILAVVFWQPGCCHTTP